MVHLTSANIRFNSSSLSFRCDLEQNLFHGVNQNQMLPPMREDEGGMIIHFVSLLVKLLATFSCCKIICNSLPAPLKFVPLSVKIFLDVPLLALKFRRRVKLILQQVIIPLTVVSVKLGGIYFFNMNVI